MLHSYTFSNFQSFASKVEVDLTINRKVALTDWMVDPVCGNRVSKLMGVVGHNASGKTALLKSLTFLHWFISQSFASAPDSPIPFYPHVVHSSEPSEFECTFDFDGSLWRYTLLCTSDMVLNETLYQKRDRFDKAFRFNYVFIRAWNPGTKSYSVKQQGFGLSPQSAKKVRTNVSLIAWAAQYDVPLAKQLASTLVVSNVNVAGRLPINEKHIRIAATHFSSRPSQQAKMNELLCLWDLGLSGIDLKIIQSNPVDAPDEKSWYPFGHHVSGATTFSLPFNLESNGTQGAFILLSSLLPVLESGGLAVIDEFENDLHPHMLEPILDLFANPQTNPHDAQLIFSTHAIEVLNLVEKSQVMLVEKDEQCISTAYRMDTVEGIRNDDNFYAKYMAGAYGAVPKL
jgi:hypothetical protein